jgi:hypothetical protein
VRSAVHVPKKKRRKRIQRIIIIIIIIIIIRRRNGAKTISPIEIRVVVFNATFNNISAISWRSVLFVQENGVPGENNIPAETH